MLHATLIQALSHIHTNMPADTEDELRVSLCLKGNTEMQLYVCGIK